MMCAFMTPVLKSDWAVHRSGAGSLNSPSPMCSPHTSSGDMATEQRRAQIMRLREVQRLRRQLAAGGGRATLPSRTSCPAMGGLPSGHASRVSLPASSLALERRAATNTTRKLHSSNSLNNLSTKVLNKLKSVLHIKEKEASKDEKREEDEEQVDSNDDERRASRRRTGSNSPEENRGKSKIVYHHRGSRSQSRNSSDAIPRIEEEKEV